MVKFQRFQEKVSKKGLKNKGFIPEIIRYYVNQIRLIGTSKSKSVIYGTCKKGGEEMKTETKKAKAAIIAAEKAKLNKDQIAHYKELATTRYDRMKYTQEYMGVLFDLANEYLVECEEKGRHMTIAGLQRKLGINSKSWYRMRNGEMDHSLYEFLELHDLPEDYADNLETKMYEGVPLITYSEFLDNLYLRQQELLEEVCINKSNPVGSIFLLKSMHHIRDDSGGVTINNNTLNVYQDKFGSLDEIEKARKLLD